ncbi:restriction endonuclease subunit S [Meiothermus hypogaeus]|uniref:Type I restriction modification DNA specificity domain protein n=1 Tax=Meiothermus hypogaeus TaxID=884155 RepID=A0ABX9MID8_9DEIN|nr:restriction endonuclease subunit S [Meiothermus hypogaeus]RIH75232.1 Type I restriction modification DNA specificity domain protein [Meiothermus hypogaeus]
MSSPTTEAPKPETRPKLPEGWRWVRLGEISEVIAGQSPPSATYRKAPEGLPFFQGKADFGERHPVATVWCTSPKKTAEAGDILISVRAPVGPTNIADQRCCIGRGLAAIRVGGLADRDFILWAIRRFEAEIAKRGSGSTFDSLPVDELRNFPIPLPPLETQRRIAAILTEQMGAVEKARKAAEEGLEAARKLPEACLRSAFPTVPITVNTAPAPKGWRWTLLTDFARLESGHTPSRRREEWWGGDIPWISLSDIRALDGKTAIQTREYTNPEGIANSSARVLPAGTVVLSRTASVGFVTVMGRPMATSQDFVNWVCGPELEPWYLAYALMASREYIRSLGSGAVHQTVYVPVVQRFRLLHPDLEMQRRIIATLNDQLAHTKHLVCGLEAQLEAIRALPAAILRRAFSGEL